MNSFKLFVFLTKSVLFLCCDFFVCLFVFLKHSHKILTFLERIDAIRLGEMIKKDENY